jgi:hypothetical protein
MAYPKIRIIHVALWVRTSNSTNPMKSKFPPCRFITLVDFFYMMEAKGIIKLFVGNTFLYLL